MTRRRLRPCDSVADWYPFAMLPTDETRTWIALAGLVVNSLGLLFAMVVASHSGERLSAVTLLGLTAVASTAAAARIAVKFART